MWLPHVLILQTGSWVVVLIPPSCFPMLRSGGLLGSSLEAPVSVTTPLELGVMQFVEKFGEDILNISTGECFCLR